MRVEGNVYRVQTADGGTGIRTEAIQPATGNTLTESGITLTRTAGW